MNATKARVLKRYPNAYRRRRCEPRGGEPRQIHEICAYLPVSAARRGSVLTVLGIGTSSAAAWENAQAQIFAEVLTQ